MFLVVLICPCVCKVIVMLQVLRYKATLALIIGLRYNDILKHFNLFVCFNMSLHLRCDFKKLCPYYQEPALSGYTSPHYRAITLTNVAHLGLFHNPRHKNDILIQVFWCVSMSLNCYVGFGFLSMYCKGPSL